jgi:hypothetical protein
MLAVKEEANGDAALELLGEIIVTYATGDTGEAPPADPTAAASDPPVPTEEEQAMSALSRDVVALVGAKSAGEAATRVKELVAQQAEIEARARTLEQSEKRSLVATLVQLRAETPATAWQNVDAEGDARQPVKRLADEPIAELRSRVEALSKANPRVRIAPPVSTKDGDESKLSEYDRAKAAEIKDPEKRAKFVGMRLAKGSK